MWTLFVCVREFLRGLAEGPDAINPHDPFPRRAEPRHGNTDPRWNGGPLPMRRPGPWHKGD